MDRYIYSPPYRAEREETMIEIIQEENWDNVGDRRGLPKNIKQIGVPDIGDRIYIENTAYQKMHPYGQGAEKMVYVMLGRFDDFAGHTCIFVEDAIKMNEVEFNGKLPVWNDDSWGYLYRKIRPEHENMIIVGWAVDICGQLPSMTAQLERVHQTYFGGIHQILLLMDTLEREEAFYSNRNGYLKRREGFYVYYDKSIPGRMEAAIEALKGENTKQERTFLDKEEKVSGREARYRDYINRGSGGYRMPQPNDRGSYSLTALLLVAILALSYSSFMNHQKMESMERALSQVELQAAMQTEVQQENVVKVEDVMGNITSTQLQSTQVPSTQIPSTQVYSTQQSTETQENTQQQEMQVQQSTQIQTEQVPQAASEADVYLTQGYYVVQAGENLAGICRKIYQTTAVMEKVCEINGIDNPDAIFVGQRLTLPD